MRDESNPLLGELNGSGQRFCLTNLSVASLVRYAVGVSSLLWLCIFAVL